MDQQIASDVRRIRTILDWWVIFSILAWLLRAAVAITNVVERAQKVQAEKGKKK